MSSSGIRSIHRKKIGYKLGIDKYAGAESDRCGAERGIEMIDRFLHDSADHLASKKKFCLVSIPFSSGKMS